MIYRYFRFSTDKQDEQQQANKIDNYLKDHNMTADETFVDAGVSGGVSYKQRNLFDLCQSLKPNDVIIVSEISRITRSGISELSEIIEKYFKPNRLRLIVCNVGLDIDCSDINPMIEMQLMMLATFAKIEKQLLQDRTKNALEARRKAGKAIGGTKELWGRKTGTDREKVMDEARAKSAQSRREAARNNPANKAFLEFIEDWQEIHGKISELTDWQAIADKLNSRGKTTSKGLPFDKNRARAMYSKVQKLYA